jgi:citrate/tricarballylate utilization protein
MSAETRSTESGAPTQAPFFPLDGLFKEAERQLTICNACRYCEGLCAVFPALERRTLLSGQDVAQLANLCHDCRACYDACMYAPPHEFELNLPKALAAIRVADNRAYMWPRTAPRLLRGRYAAAVGIPAVAVILLALAAAHAGLSALVAAPSGAGSPYPLIPYPVLLAVAGLPALFAVVVMAAGGVRFWQDTGGSPAGLTFGAVRQMVTDAVTLRYLRGGGIGCYYEQDDEPSPVRRHLHWLVSGGFSLCLVSTAAAGAMQDIAGIDPPYPVASVPVITGLIGGIGMVVGCTALLFVKAGSSRDTTTEQMVGKDYALLTALDVLAVTGLLTLLTRDTPAYGIVLIVHLVAVAFTFLSAPYSKFTHIIYRTLALVRDNLESTAAAAHDHQ